MWQRSCTVGQLYYAYREGIKKRMRVFCALRGAKETKGASMTRARCGGRLDALPPAQSAVDAMQIGELALERRHVEVEACAHTHAHAHTHKIASDGK